jgi:hypothetical protein
MPSIVGGLDARRGAPDHQYYASVKDRKDSKRAALSEARKIVRQACHKLAVARRPRIHSGGPPSGSAKPQAQQVPGMTRHDQPMTHQAAVGSCHSPVSGPGASSPPRAGHPIHHHVTGL